MSENSMGFLDALSLVRKKRPIVFPNPGFQKQLHDFEKKLKVAKAKEQPKTSASPAQSQKLMPKSDLSLRPYRSTLIRTGGHAQSQSQLTNHSESSTSFSLQVRRALG